MKDKILLKTFTKNYRQYLQDFMRNNWSPNHLFSKESTVFDWLYQGKESYNFFVAKKGKNIIGAHGFIPLSHFDSNLKNNQIFLAFWAAEKNQGIGIGLKLHKKLISEVKPKFIGSLGINEAAIPFHKWQGFKVGEMVHSVALSPFINDFIIAKIPKNFKITPGRINKGISYKIIGLKELNKINNRYLFSEFWPTKSIKYIVNRYVNNPFYSYKIYKLYNNKKLLGLFVIRKISKNDQNVLRIVDYYGSNESFGLSYSMFKDLLKKHNAEYIDMYSFGIPKSILENAGLINKENQKGLVIPNYFEPFVKKNINISFAYKAENPHPPVRLFKGDGDQERPSQI